MLLFPPSRVSLLLLMGLFTATLATMLYEVLRREFSVPAGMAAAVLLISLPVVQLYSRRVMMEIPLAVLFYIAVLVYGRYLDNPRWQDAAWFGLVASLACLTNGSGFLLALVPVFSVLLTWRFRLLGRCQRRRPGICSPRVLSGKPLARPANRTSWRLTSEVSWTSFLAFFIALGLDSCHSSSPACMPTLRAGPGTAPAGRENGWWGRR